MGKRKERRLAAKIGAGRRFKLDLFAEPSGDLGDSSAKDEVGKDMDAKLDAELSNSPSSSGQKEDNPLSLLGQYSDDELDQESYETESRQKDSLVNDDDQTKVSVSKTSEGVEVGGADDLSVQKPESCDPETDTTLVAASPIVEASADEKHHEADKEKADHVPEASDTQSAGDASSGWKMVLHEESNQYYYWNTVTGETSWEVPDALSQGPGTANEHLSIEMRESHTGDINATAFGSISDDFSTMHNLAYTNGVTDVGKSEHVPEANQSVEQSKGDVAQLLGTSSEVGVLPCGTNYSQYNQLNTGAVNSSAVGFEVHGCYSMISEEGAVDPLQLINHGESLLERLKSLQWCGFDSDEHGWVSKYILEVEIRLSDIRSLSPHGQSLLLFWLYSDRQLNEVENGINAEIERQKNKISEINLNFAERSNEMAEDGKGESKVNEDVTQLSPENSSAIVRATTDASVVPKALHDEASNVEIFDEEQVTLDGHPTHLHDVEEGGQEIDVNAAGKESPKSGFQSVEDVDMEIDMEVEDVSAGNRTVDMGGQMAIPSEQVAQPDVFVVGECPGTGSEFIPPPPDEEWIPPPPPDNEGIPPPPPDEPPESVCPPPPPAEPEPMQSFYSDHYNLAYAETNVNYYASTTTGTSGCSFYEPADGSQMAVLNLPAYYAAISNAQAATVPMPVSSVAYYGLQNGVMPVFPADSTIGSSSIQATSSVVNCGPLFSNQIATVDASAEASLLSNQFIEPLVPGAKADAASTEASASVVSAPATISVKEYVSVPSFSATASCVSIPATSASVTSTSAVTDLSTAVTKAQPKVARMKKPKVAVASSLRSNKKVSSLVDKWKAAKEELEEEEEEVWDSPLEILEKKRQREIEEWRAQQIASGEAKENANFQPLGGDWRERVKRRRLKKESSAKKSLDAIKNESKQPDLNELSKDLPGWQAYWDDSSKQVYYANSITSETTWTKPTR